MLPFLGAQASSLPTVVDVFVWRGGATTPPGCSMNADGYGTCLSGWKRRPTINGNGNEQRRAGQATRPLHDCGNNDNTNGRELVVGDTDTE